MLDCIVLAGGIPSTEDLLYEETQSKPKALIDIAGKAMGQWVVDAFTTAPCINRMTIVGLTRDQGITSPKVAAYLPDQGAFLTNIIAGIDQVLAWNAQTQHVLLSTADIPLITSSIVEHVVAQWEALNAQVQADLYYHIVPRALMEQRFPDAQRSYVHLVDGDFAGADMHIVAPHLAHSHQALWQGLLGSRKNAFKQALRLGGDFFLKLLMRRLSLAEIEKRVPERLGISVKAMPVKFAEIGMDVDKPVQLAICRQNLNVHAHQ